MGSNTFPQQQSMGQMPQQMAPMQQQDQQTGFSGMYAPQYGAMASSFGNMQGYGGAQVAQGYGGGQSVPNYAMQGNVMPQQQAQYFDPMVSNMASQGNQSGLVAPQIYNPQVSPQYFDPSKITQQDVYTGYDPSSYKLTEGYAAAVANGTEGLYKAEPDNLQFPQQLSQQQQADYIAANPNAPRGYVGSQSVPNYQVPQVQQQPVAGYGGYAQQPMQQNPYGGGKVSSRQGPQRLY